MKKTIVFLMSIIGAHYCWAEGPAREYQPALYQCVSQEAGITFGCDSSWKLNRKEKKLRVTISEIPHIEMNIEENDQTLRFMSELTHDALASLGRYEEGFVIKRIFYCNREAVKVSGYLKGDSNTFVLDFFLMDHQNIHSVKFTVRPKEEIQNYGGLIQRVVETITFVKHKPGVKFFTEETEESCTDLISNEKSGT